MLECFGFLIAIAAIFMPIASLVLSVSGRRRTDRLEGELSALRSEISSLREMVAQRPASAPTAAPVEPTETEPVDVPLPAPYSVQSAEPVVTQPEAAPPIIESLPEVLAPSFAQARGGETPATTAGEDAGVTLPIVEPAITQPMMEEAVTADAVQEPLPLTRGPEAPAPPPRRIDWESLIGVKLFSWIAGICFALAAVLFIRHGVEHGWLRPSIRAAIGIAVGAGLIILCEMKAALRYRVTANALDGAGVAILYATIFAMNARWQLLPLTATFLLMVVVTVVAVFLALRRDSVFIALLGLFGGFLTPAILSTGQDRPISLFGYLLLLNAGLAWLAYKKQWPALSIITFVLTTAYEWGWVVKFLDRSELGIGAAVFLAFPILTIAAMMLARRKGDDVDRRFSGTAQWSAALPLFFAAYGAAVPELGSRYVLLFGFLALVSLGLAFLAVARKMEALHMLGGVAAILTFAIWFARAYDSTSAWPSILAFVALFVVIYAATPSVANWLKRPLSDEGRGSLLIAPLFLFTIPLLAMIEPRTADATQLFVVLFVLLLVIAATAIHHARGSIYFIASFFALAAEAIWSAKHLSTERLGSASVVYVAFAILFLTVPTVARRVRNPLRPHYGTSLLVLGSLLLLLFLAGGNTAPHALGAISLLILLLNAGFFFEAGVSGRTGLIPVGIVLTWIVLAVWAGQAELAGGRLAVATAAIVGFALLTLTGAVYVHAKVKHLDGRRASYVMLYLALGAHLFLLAFATEKALAIPPLSIFAGLIVLNLGFAAATLHLNRAGALLASFISTGIVLATWQWTAGAGVWPSIGAVAVALLIAFAIGVAAAAKKREAVSGNDARGFVNALFASALTGQVVLALNSAHGTPPFLLVLAVHLFATFVVIVSALRFSRLGLLIPGVVTSAYGYFAYGDALDNASRWNQLTLALALLLPFVLVPVAMADRVRHSRLAHYAAIAATVPFFFFGKSWFEQFGYDNVIAILPLFEAALLGLVLWRLLKIETLETRDTGRLAMVAGVILAFVTVAVPLQLEKEWVTVAWGLEVAALAWLYLRIPHRGLLAWSTILSVVVFARLALNPAVLSYHPRSSTPIINWYLYTYLVCAIAFFTAAYLLKKSPDEVVAFKLKASSWLGAAATILLFLLLNIEIADYFSNGPNITFNFNAGLAQDLAYTIAWALFSIALLIAAIYLRNRPGRFAAIALLIVTILKCFLHDLARLGGLYRVASFVGLAICLAFVAVLLQKFVLVTPASESE